MRKLIKIHGTILSDSRQTSHAASAWQSLIKFPGEHLRIWVYDPRTKHRVMADTVDASVIWNKKPEPVLMITAESYTEVELESMERNNQYHLLKKTGRDHDSIWFGPGTSNSVYNNP
jgi:tRNA pseudouridine-54 N-methylase